MKRCVPICGVMLAIPSRITLFRQHCFWGVKSWTGSIVCRSFLWPCFFVWVGLTATVLGSAFGENKKSTTAERRLSATAQSDYSISVDVSLVLVPAIVTDRKGRIVPGLRRENFRLLEDGAPQDIVSLSTEDVPASVGLVFDVSGSMKDKMASARSAAHRFLETANPDDEFFLVTFADKPAVEVDMTSEPWRIENTLLFSKTGGATALIDAVRLALHRVRTGRRPRKAVVVVSDGGDNHSRYREVELRSYALESDAQIYTIGIHGDRNGLRLLENLSNATGGLHFEVWGRNDLTPEAVKIGRALRDQYVIAYQSSNRPADGKVHKIQVKLDLPAGTTPLHVDARKAYRLSR